MRNESSSAAFHSVKAAASSALVSPPTVLSTSYASEMSCMSPYSMPLCTILTKLPGAAGTHIRHARAAVRLRAHLLHHVFDDVERRAVAAGHHRGAVTSALLAAGDAHAEVKKTLLRSVLLATLGVLVPLVAAVDDDIPGLHVLGETRDRGVHGRARLDKDDHAARLGEGLDELAHVLVPDEVRRETLLLRASHGVVRLIRGAVVHGDLKTLLGDVEREVLREQGNKEGGGSGERNRARNRAEQRYNRGAGI